MKLTKEQWSEAAEKYRSGISSVKIANEYGVHYTTVLENMRRLGEKVRTHYSDGGPIMTPEVIARVDVMASAGFSGREIARRLGISYTLVYRRHKFNRPKSEKPIKITNKDKRALDALLSNLERFRATERGAAQALTLDPQISALRRVLR